MKLVFVDDFNVPTNTPFESIGAEVPHVQSTRQSQHSDTSVEKVLSNKASGEFGGISAIAYDSSGQLLLALSDTVKPVLFVFRLKIDDGKLSLSPQREIPLTDEYGTRLPAWSIDPEAMAILPGGTMLIASEGFAAGIPRAGVAPTNPAIYEFSQDGRQLRPIRVPNKLLGLTNDSTGTHRNQGIESMTISADGNRIFLATEGSLKQDGPAADLEHGSRIRIIETSVEPGSIRPSCEYVVEVDAPPVPSDFRNPQGARGLTELLAVDRKALLALERSFIFEGTDGAPTPRSEQRIEIFQLDLTSSSDVASVESLSQTKDYVPAIKTLVLDLRDIIPELQTEYQSLDNFEGMCFGPLLADGSRSLILVSDNNFNPTQRTCFLLFKLLDQ